MQNLELYIEGQRVDLFKDESITVTDTLKNVRDIKKIFTAFSQQFSLPASRVNNKIFKHYYNFDIDNGFDARVKKDALIKLNGVDYKKGKIKLNGVALKFNKAHTYKIVFFGNTVDLKDLIGEDKLNTLTGLNSSNIVWNSANVKSKLTAVPSLTDVIVPLITHTDRLFYDSGSTVAQSNNLFYNASTVQGVLHNQLKFAIRVRKIVEAIESKYGLTFSSDFFTASNAPYNSLFMWLHRKSGAPEQVVSTGTEVQLLETPVDNWTPTSGFLLANMVDDSTLRITSEWDEQNDGSIGDADMDLIIESTDTKAYGVKVYKDGVLRREETGLTANTSISAGELGISAGLFGVGKTFAAGDWTVSIIHSGDKELTKCRWIVSGNTIGSSLVFEAAPFTAFNQFDFIITQQIPEIKTIDFLTGLFKMFNLVAFEQDDGTIFVDTLDSFNSTGTSYDITEFVDVNSSQSNVSLPYSEIIFRFEGLKSFLANAYKEINNEEWGSLRYNQDNISNKIDGGSYKVEIPFEHFLFERLFDINDTTGATKTDIQWGWSVNKDQQPDKDLPLLFYPIRITSGSNPISFRESASSAVSLSHYIIPSNSLFASSSSGTQNINFDLMTNEYTGTSDFTGTLFENYYKTYIENIFNARNRLLKLKAYLPQKILINYNLNDIFVINGKEYRINSIKTNLLTNKSDLELIVKL
tara:strand:+ start:493 stop:2577 length:2085 start_codon:yes stop_codon:yes gene_type:complete